jgi:hypothetical protein
LIGKVAARADRIGAKVVEVQGLADERKAKIKGLIEHLQLQFAVGRIATNDALFEQKQLIENAATAARTHIGGSLDQMNADLDKEIKELVDVLVELDAEGDERCIQQDRISVLESRRLDLAPQNSSKVLKGGDS